jgi:hypothetical protein
MKYHIKFAVISNDPTSTVAELSARLPDYIVVKDGSQLHSLTGHLLVSGPFPSYLFGDTVERDSITVVVMTPEQFNEALKSMEKLNPCNTFYGRSLQRQFNTVYTHEGDSFNFYGGSSINSSRNSIDDAPKVIAKHWEAYSSHHTMLYYPIYPVKPKGHRTHERPDTI